MPDLFDTAQIPDDPGHWDALAERVAATAVEQSNRGGFHWLANSRAGWIAASLLLAAAVAFAIRPGSSSMSVTESWAQALSPADDIGKTLIHRSDPPAIGALLISNARGDKK